MDIDYAFRGCEAQDIDFLMRLKRECFKWYVERIYGWQDDVQYNLTRIEMDKHMHDMNIIEVDNKDIGLFTFYIDENNDGCIGMFAILPEYQGNGLGTKILTDVINNNKSRRLYLKTYMKNPARYLYQRMGFEKYGDTETHWLMERKPQ